MLSKSLCKCLSSTNSHWVYASLDAVKVELSAAGSYGASGKIVLSGTKTLSIIQEFS